MQNLSFFLRCNKVNNITTWGSNSALKGEAYQKKTIKHKNKYYGAERSTQVWSFSKYDLFLFPKYDREIGKCRMVSTDN